MKLNEFIGKEIWTALNPKTGRREIIDQEAELILGEKIVKLFWAESLKRYVSIPGESIFTADSDGFLQLDDSERS